MTIFSILEPMATWHVRCLAAAASNFEMTPSNPIMIELSVWILSTPWNQFLDGTVGLAWNGQLAKERYEILTMCD